jgi:O-antigen/teichoic acid export membrane protein
VNEAMRVHDSKRSEVERAMTGLFGRDSLYMVLWAVQLLVAALFTPILTRVLGPYRFGTVATAIAVMQVLVAIGSFSLQTAVQRAYARPNGERNARRLVTLAVAVSLATYAVANGTGPLWCPLIGLGRYTTIIHYAVFWSAMTAICNAALGLLRSRDQLLAFATVSLLQSVIAEALALALILLVRRTASEYVLGQMIAQVATVVVALAVARPALPHRADIPMLGDALRYSNPLVLTALAAYVLDASDRLIIHHDLGSVAVGRYAVARNIGGLAIILLGVLNSVWMPRVFALTDFGVRRSVLAASRDAVYALLIPVLVGLTAGSSILLSIWVPPSYRPNGLLLIVAVVAITAFPVAGIASAWRVLLYGGKTASIAAISIVAAGANIELNILFVPILGITGSALATLLCYSLEAALLAIVAVRVMRLPRPPSSLLSMIAIAIAVAIGSTRIPTGGIFLAVRVLIAVVSLLAFVAMLSSIVAPDRAAWAGRLTSWIHVPAPDRTDAAPEGTTVAGDQLGAEF